MRHELLPRVGHARVELLLRLKDLEHHRRRAEARPRQRAEHLLDGPLLRGLVIARAAPRELREQGGARVGEVAVASLGPHVAHDAARAVVLASRHGDDGEVDELVAGSPREVRRVLDVGEVRDRRLEGARISGGPSWLSGCADAVRGAFQGDLPEAEDTEYTIRFAVTLTPSR